MTTTYKFLDYIYLDYAPMYAPMYARMANVQVDKKGFWTQYTYNT